MFSDFGSLLLVICLAYGLGSIPFGLILTRLAGAGDIRQFGSGNIGATNVLRTGNKKLAIATLVFDAGKGAAAVLFASHFTDAASTALAAILVVIGHCFPVWLNFKGGKGVATSFGFILALDFQIGLAVSIIWIFIFLLKRISGLSAIISFLFLPLITFVISDSQIFFLVSILHSIIILLNHHKNIREMLES